MNVKAADIHERYIGSRLPGAFENAHDEAAGLALLPFRARVDPNDLHLYHYTNDACRAV
jgi:hypothetical protein